MLSSAIPTLADVARRLKRSKAAANLPRLILMTDSGRLPDPLPATAACRQGVP